MLVPEKLLLRANGMNQTMLSLVSVLSPVIAAGIIYLPLNSILGVDFGGLTNGASLAIIIDAITFFIAAITLIFLHIPSPQRENFDTGGPVPSLWLDVKQGATYIWHRWPLLWLLGTIALANFVAAPMVVLQPLLIKFNLAADWSARGFTFETALALLATLGSIGSIAGGFAISMWGGFKNQRIYAIIVPAITIGIAQMLFGASSLLYLSAAMIFIFNAMFAILNVHSQAIWQTQTPHELQGRVFAVRRLIAQFSWPFSMMLASWSSTLLSPGVVIVALGLILVIFCIMQLFNPYILRVEDKKWLDEMAALRASKAASLTSDVNSQADDESTYRIY